MTPTSLALRLLDDHARAQLQAAPGTRVDLLLRFAAVTDGIGQETVAYSRLPHPGDLELAPRVRAELAEALHAAGDALTGRDRDVIGLEALDGLITTRALSADAGPIVRRALEELRTAVRRFTRT